MSSSNIEKVTPLYDYLRQMSGREEPEIKATFDSERKKILGLKISDEEKKLKLAELEQGRQKRLTQVATLENAIAALKDKPGNAEANGELENYVKALIPFSADLLLSQNPNIRAYTLDTVKPLFTRFRDIYAEKYSEEAIKELLADKKIDPTKADELRATRDLLNNLTKDLVQPMQKFLKEFDAHPEKLDPMVFTVFRDIYTTRYSDDAIKELISDNKITIETATELRSTRDSLSNFVTDLATKKPEDQMLPMQELLKKLSTRPELLDPAIFEDFVNIYTKNYSDDAILKELNQIPGRVYKLNETKNLLDKLAKEDQVLLMHKFLKDFDKHSDLLGPMVEALAKYRRENMNNIERGLDNFNKSALQTLKSQSAHADYLQAWERVGYMSTNLLRAVINGVIMSATGQTIPFDEPEQAPGSTDPAVTEKQRLDIEKNKAKTKQTK